MNILIYDPQPIRLQQTAQTRLGHQVTPVQTTEMFPYLIPHHQVVLLDESVREEQVAQWVQTYSQTVFVIVMMRKTVSAIRQWMRIGVAECLRYPVTQEALDKVLVRFAPVMDVAQVTAVTEASVVAQAPAFVQAQTVAHEPVVIAEVPGIAETSVVAETHVVSEEPVFSEELIAVQAPVVAQAQVVTQAPLVAQTPVAAQAPVVTQASVATQAPPAPLSMPTEYTAAPVPAPMQETAVTVETQIPAPAGYAPTELAAAPEPTEPPTVFPKKIKWALEPQEGTEATSTQPALPQTALAESRFLEPEEMALQLKRQGIVAVTSARGGVGKSTITYNLAALAQKAGVQTVIIDNDPRGNMASISNSKYRYTADQWEKIDPVNDGENTVMNLLAKMDCGASLLPSGKRLNGMSADTFDKVMQILRRYFQLILIDCEPRFTPATLTAYQEATTVLVVSPGDVSTFARTIEKIDQMRGDLEIDPKKIKLVLNRVDKDFDKSEEAILVERSGCKLLAKLPHSPEVPKLQKQGKPAAMQQKLPFAKHMKSLLERLILLPQGGVDTKTEGHSFFSKIFKKSS